MTFSAALVCLVGWYGSPALAQILGYNTFFQPDMALSAAYGLFFALGSLYLLPHKVVTAFQSAWTKCVAWRLFLLPVVFAAVLASLIWINHAILHQFLNSADEHSCYFMAELIRMGKWWVEPHPLSDFFNVVHVGNRDGKWFSVYPPGWPLLWAAGLQLNIADWINPLLTALSLPLLYGAARRLFGPAVALGGILLTVMTPFFLFTGASYFSHATCLFMMSAFIYCFIRWQQEAHEKKRFLWACLAAAACGYGLMTRYLTMAAFALPFLAWHYGPLFLRKKKWAKSDFAPVVILTLFMAAILYQNYAVTGKPFKAPNKYDKSWERLGFKGDYSVVEGLLYIVFRFFYLMDYAAPLLIVLFLAGIVQRPPAEPGLNRLFRYSFFYGSFVYFLYFSWGGNQYGPRYWWESFPFLCFIAAERIGCWWKSGDKALQKFLAGAILVLLPANAYSLYKQGTFLEQATRERKSLYLFSEQTLDAPSIIFIRGFLGDALVMSEDDAVRNSPKLDGRILYAHDLGGRNQELMKAFPARSYYRGTYDRKSKQAVLERLDS